MFKQLKYGVEYIPKPHPEGSGGLGWVFLAVAVVGAISLSWTLWNRFHREPVGEMRAEPVENVATNAAPLLVQSVAPVKPIADLDRRPPKVRNLLMRLSEAESRRDLEMAVSTIEQIRALPGSPAADLDDALARRLGVLNMRRLFVGRNAQWVLPVTVKRGDSASRIASEHGATLSSVIKLNGGDVERIFVGKKLYVMNHPRFQLAVRRRMRTADLTLNGKFFKRYDLTVSSGKAGVFELPLKTRQFWKDLGVSFKPADRSEIEMLMPAGSPVLVSEM